MGGARAIGRGERHGGPREVLYAPAVPPVLTAGVARMLLDAPRSGRSRSRPRPHRWAIPCPTARVIPALAVVGVLLLTGQMPSWAHAGSELPIANWSAQGDVVTGTWTGPPDDAAWIGESIGVLDDGAMEAYVGGSSAAYPTEEEITALSRSPELEAYLREHVRVRQQGEDCEAEVTVADDFIADGAGFRFVCPTDVRTVDIEITILHDQDPAFRTFSGDGTLQDALHTAETPVHTWDFARTDADAAAGAEPSTEVSSGAAATTSRRLSVILTLVVGAAVVLAGVVGAFRLLGAGRRR